ncbi:Hpt domain-containing protein [Magnetofaba australis]|uniref:Putative signal transduction histidine kinase n=1 Tax=Magnetofaba australis IT-1 TaxID=1434232 RepID=A0A1Y2K7F4_9PROT|nr:Hpt domain-containing protein [Magnetofaba australis]OSM05288.1 putative signal transduction histidine kinase [Magnetofaba australis IT-1]
MTKALDSAAIDLLRQELGEDLSLFIETYLQLLPGRIHAIEESVRARDAKQLGAQAHTLKSSSLQLGAHELARCVIELERLSQQEAWAEIDPLAPRVVALAHATREALESIA